MRAKSWIRAWAAAALLALVAGCASYAGSDLVAGKSTEAQVRASMGQPAMVAHVGNETWLYYPRGEFARQTFVARIGSDGVLRGIEQRLDVANIGKLQIGKSNMEDARLLFGPPHQITYFALSKRTVWEYKILDNPTKRLLEVQFSDDGIVREVLLLYDHEYDKSGGGMAGKD
jgi:outer membrane protein assembly factor BamE (lipoprotein component of BamABCDE complex)